MEHALSAVYDITHGTGLAILMTHWMEEILSVDDSTFKKFAEFARYVWDIKENDSRKVAARGIQALRDWLKSIGMPVYLSEVKISADRFEEIVSKSVPGSGGTSGNFHPLDAAGIKRVLTRAATA